MLAGVGNKGLENGININIISMENGNFGDDYFVLMINSGICASGWW